MTLKQLFCRHYWRGTDTESAESTAIRLNFRDVQCTKCGKKTRMTREAYTRHMVETKRINT